VRCVEQSGKGNTIGDYCKLTAFYVKPTDPESFPEYTIIDLDENQLGRTEKIENNKKITCQPLSELIKKLRAISVHDGVAYIRVDLPARNTLYNKNDEAEDVQYTYEPYFVTSKGELIHTDKPELRQQFQIPVTVRGNSMRWMYSDIIDFCKNNSTLDLKDLYYSTEQLFRKYIDFPEDGYYAVCSLWIIGTYTSKLFSYYPYLDFLGSPGSVKSKTLDLMEKLSYNGRMSNKISGASIYRSIESSGNTLLLGETEYLKDPKHEQSQVILSILKGAFKTDGKIMVSITGNGKNSWTPYEFEAGTCIALGHINELDSVLQERTIQINLLKTINKKIGNIEIPETDYDELLVKQRCKFYRFFLKYFSDVINQKKRPYKNEKISNRELNQIWKPLMTLAILFERNGVDNLIKRIECIIDLNHHKNVISNESSNVDVQILNYIIDYFAEKKILPIGDTDDAQNWFKQNDIVHNLKLDDEFGWINSKNIGTPLNRLNLTRLKKASGMCIYLDREILINLCKQYGLDHQTLMNQSDLSSLSSPESSHEQKIDAQNDDNDENNAKINSKELNTQTRRFHCKTCGEHYTTDKILKEMQKEHNITHSGHEIKEITHKDEQK